MLEGYEDDMDDSDTWVGDWSRDPAAYGATNAY